MSNDKVNEGNFKNQLIDALAVRFKTSIPTIKRWLEGTCEPHPVIKQAVLKSLITDHERIVAELKTVVEQKDVVVAATETMACIVREKEKTIATQKRVIEKLREQRDIELEDNCWDDALTGGRPFEQARKMMDEEIQAIEKGES